LNQYIRRLLRLVAAIAAIAAAAAVVVVAASFALYALVEPYLGQAGAAGVVTGVFAFFALILAWIASRKVAAKPKAHHRGDDQSVIDRLMVMAKERPLVALGAAAAAAAVLVRNPAIITAVVSAFVAGNASKPGK
jgi:Na+/melibiose symporter-like transporter